MNGQVRRRNRLVVTATLSLLIAMSGLVYYSVPLYRLFCQVTGFGGTTQTAARAPGAVGERVITVQFLAETSSKLPWTFRPLQRKTRVRVGEESMAFLEARNLSDRPVTGSAVFNVTPQKAGQYFDKIQCFCFTEQRLAPGASARLPVSFFIDPAILDDRNLDDVGTITLTYIFYRAEPDAPAPRQVSEAESE